MPKTASPTTVETLSTDEALDLLQNKSFVGRVAFVVDGLPVVFPVNYLAESPEAIVFCSGAGTKLSVLAGGAPVAFEVDSSRPLFHTGWSVLVRGTAREVTDADELARLRRGPLRSWATPSSEHWIRISVEDISGRRIAGF